MFRKPPTLKPASPLRTSALRRLRQSLLTLYSLSEEHAATLVPDGLLTRGFVTSSGAHGVVYVSPSGDPLWFSLGKDDEGEVIPTVYTLWKHPEMLPSISTPAVVIDKISNGADLMIPGVVHYPSTLVPDQLVCITRYDRQGLGPPMAVGRMAVASDALGDEEAKGKAVLVLHAWKDGLWEAGKGREGEVPEVRAWPTAEEEEEKLADAVENIKLDEASPPPQEPSSPTPTFSPEDISSILHASLLQALQTTLASPPPGTIPMPASTLWAAHVLPARPVQPLGRDVFVDVSAIDIKASTHKNVKTFLKACAKEGLIKVKETKSDLVVTAVYPQHPSVLAHRPHKTVQSVEEKREKEEARERKQREEEEKRKGDIVVMELWKPFGTTIGWWVATGHDTSKLYTVSEIKDVFNAYVAEKNLVNAHDQQYINTGDDESLAAAVHVKGGDSPEFMKREDALRRIRTSMQAWHEIRTESGAVAKKGEAKPISVAVKMRQGRKACTFVTGFETFGLHAEALAEELRKACASSTSVAPLAGKTSGMEVMVQGKQTKAISELLAAKGVSSNWIHVQGASAKKK